MCNVFNLAAADEKGQLVHDFFTVAPMNHGLNDDERQHCEIWTQVTGYHRPVTSFNPGKQSEYRERRHFSDVKAPFADYSNITGVPSSGEKTRISLQHLLDSGVAYEVRTTVDPQWLDHDQLWTLAQELKAQSVNCFILQRCRNEEPVGRADPLANKELVQEISALFEKFALRS